MEDCVKQPEQSSKVEEEAPETLGEIIEDWVIFYMNIGVPLDEILNGDTDRLPLYYKAYQKKSELDFEEKNFQLWLQGLYNYRALTSSFNDFKWWFNGGNGIHPEAYPDSIIPFTDNEMKRHEEREKEKTLQFFKKGQTQDG